MQCFLFHLAAEYLNHEVSAPSSDRLLNIRSTDSPYYLSPLILKIFVEVFISLPWKSTIRRKAPKTQPPVANMLDVAR